MKPRHVTVVIVTWNRCELLRETLEQLTKVSVPPALTFDCLVVNNNCTDATDAVIDDFCGRLPLRRVFEPAPGASSARNAALAMVTGEYVLFTDDDVLVDEGWLVEFEAATRAFPDAVAIGGIIEPWFPQPPDPDLVEAFPALKNGFCGVDHGPRAYPLPDDRFIFGANMAFRMEALGELRFSPTLGPSPTSLVYGEEIDLIRRLRASRGSVAWWPTMRVRHYVDPFRMSLEYLLKYFTAWGTMQVRLGPSSSARSVFGAPPWLWRQYAAAWSAFLIAHVTKAEVIRLYPKCPVDSKASRRVRTLSWRREAAILTGMIRGYRQLERRRAAPGSETPSPVARSV